MDLIAVSTLRPSVLAFAARRTRWSSVNRIRRGPELLAQHPVLLLQIVDDVALLLVDIAGHGHQEKPERV